MFYFISNFSFASVAIETLFSQLSHKKINDTEVSRNEQMNTAHFDVQFLKMHEYFQSCSTSETALLSTGWGKDIGKYESLTQSKYSESITSN